jgi:hypothetical protein
MAEQQEEFTILSDLEKLKQYSRVKAEHEDDSDEDLVSSGDDEAAPTTATLAKEAPEILGIQDNPVVVDITTPQEGISEGLFV